MLCNDFVLQLNNALYKKYFHDVLRLICNAVYVLNEFRDSACALGVKNKI